MSNHKITIVTPTYNRAHTLTRVYESLKYQTFKDFKWLIMDDGSIDNTKALVADFQKEDIIDIEYFWNPNAKKFFTVFEGIKKVNSEYFTILDSDDAYIEKGLEIMYNTINQINRDKYISATFNSQFPDGTLVGSLFPENFDGSILEMRYKHQVKGDKHTIFLTEKYQTYLNKFNYHLFKNKYAPQKIFFNIYDGNGEKSKFVNENIRIYYQDDNDVASMSNDRVKPSSYFGLMEGHLSFLNNYGKQLFAYPKALIRNIVGYHQFSILLGRSTTTTIDSIRPLLIKTLATFIYPLSYLYTKKNN